MKLCPAEVDASRELAKRGGLQDHSIGGPYPWIVVGIENPVYYKATLGDADVGEPVVLRGLFYYVQNPDGSIGSLLFEQAETAHEVASQIKEGLIPPITHSKYTWAGYYGN